LQKAKNQIEAEWVMGGDSNFNRAMQIGMAETTGASYGFVEHFVENIRKVTAEEVQRVAESYLTETNKSVGILVIPVASKMGPLSGGVP